MNDETRTTMKPEEAIIEIRSLQVKHNQEIKQLQEDFKAVQNKIATSIDEANKNIKEELNTFNDKFTSHVMTTNNQIDTGLNKVKEEMEIIIGKHTHKLHNETKMIQEHINNWTSMIQEIKELSHNLVHANNRRQNEERALPPDNNENNTEVLLPPKEVQQDRNIPSPTTNMDTVSIQTNPADYSGHKMQTILLPPPTTAPLFHGKSTERPWQFLIRVEEYTETVLMWGQDALLRGISQFLKDTALEWYCQLRSCHSLPKTWRDFKQTFIGQFNSPLRMAQQQKQWNQCRQGNEETINEFIIRLRALWVEQYPQETESDLIKHLFCKMHPDMLNIMGCPRNASLQEILLEAQRVEEILYYRTNAYNQSNTWSTNINYFNDNTINKNVNSMNKTQAQFQTNAQTYSRTRNSTSYQQTQRNQPDRQQLSCYNCGRSNHIARDCWHQNGNNNNNNSNNNINYSHQSTSFSKNE